MNKAASKDVALTVFVPVTREAHPRLPSLVMLVPLQMAFENLPVGRLPCKKKRRRKHRIRVKLGEVCNAIMQTLQSKARVMKREVSRFTRLTDPRQMRRRKCENRVHHKGV